MPFLVQCDKKYGKESRLPPGNEIFQVQAACGLRPGYGLLESLCTRKKLLHQTFRRTCFVKGNVFNNGV